MINAVAHADEVIATAAHCTSRIGQKRRLRPAQALPGLPSTADCSEVSVQFGSGPGAAIVATVDEVHSLSEHANPLRSVHANRASGATS